MCLENITRNNNNSIINLFANFFSISYTDERVTQIPQYQSRDSLYTTSCYIEDGIPLQFFKTCTFILAKSLQIIFNISLSMGTFSIHKSGQGRIIKTIIQ